MKNLLKIFIPKPCLIKDELNELLKTEQHFQTYSKIRGAGVTLFAKQKSEVRRERIEELKQELG